MKQLSTLSDKQKDILTDHELPLKISDQIQRLLTELKKEHRVK